VPGIFSKLFNFEQVPYLLLAYSARSLRWTFAPYPQTRKAPGGLAFGCAGHYLWV
jgi:hypothetical protein